MKTLYLNNILTDLTFFFTVLISIGKYYFRRTSVSRRSLLLS